LAKKKHSINLISINNIINLISINNLINLINLVSGEKLHHIASQLQELFWIKSQGI